jgi:hypothetical protein
MAAFASCAKAHGMLVVLRCRDLNRQSKWTLGLFHDPCIVRSPGVVLAASPRQNRRGDSVFARICQ